MFLLFYLILGLVLGSFFGVLVTRRLDPSSLTGRSACPKCSKALSWYELIPIFSFLVQNGRCRSCRKPISAFYLSTELITAFVLATFLARTGPTGINWLNLFLLLVFVLLFLFDLKFFILPDLIVLPAIIITLWFNYPYFLTALALGAFFAIMFLSSRGRWLGFGDVKLAFLIGVAFGYPWGVLVVIASVWAGAIWALILLALRKADLKTPLPFGAYLAATSIFYIIFAHEIQKLLARFF